MGVLITILDTVVVLSLKGQGFRRVEAIVFGLVLTISACYFVELWLRPPVWGDVAKGLLPHLSGLTGLEPWYLSIGILGATVMPHNLYLHSSIVQTRSVGHDRKLALKLNTFDTIVSLLLAFVVNAAILILAATAFHFTGHQNVTGIDEAYRILEPLTGTGLASILFAIALLAAGQSSTFTGTIAGQIVMEGFMNWRIPCWQRRLITRGLALVPAYFGVAILGDHAIGKLLVLSQVILCLQLPFVVFPLIRFASSRELMGPFQIGGFAKLLSWALFLVISIANFVLLYKVFWG